MLRRRVEGRELVPVAPIQPEIVTRREAPSEGIPKTEELVEGWLLSLKPKTARQYGNDIAALARFMRLPDAAAVLARLIPEGHWRCEQTVTAWAREMAKPTPRLPKGAQPATLRRRVAALRSLLESSHCPWKVKVKLPKVTPYKNTSGPGDESVARILDLCERICQGDSPPLAALRDRAIVLLMLSAGFRRNEVSSLDIDCVERERSGFWILGKGRDEREFAPAPANAMAAVEMWHEARLRVFPATGGPLFIALDAASRGRRLTGDGIYLVVSRTAEAAKVPHTWPHALRHRCLTDIVKETNGDVVTTSAVGRHKKKETTFIYIDNLKKQAVAGVAASSAAQARVLEDWRKKTEKT